MDDLHAGSSKLQAQMTALEEGWEREEHQLFVPCIASSLQPETDVKLKR